MTSQELKKMAEKSGMGVVHARKLRDGQIRVYLFQRYMGGTIVEWTPRHPGGFVVIQVDEDRGRERIVATLPLSAIQ